MKPVYTSLAVTTVRRYGRLAWIRASIQPGYPVVKAEPPQFAMLWVPGLEAIPMSIAWLDDTGIEFIVRPVGPTTGRLYESRPGDILGCICPLGKSLWGLIPPDARRVLLVGGGSGVAPILFLAPRLANRSFEVDVVLGFRDSAEAGIREVFEMHGVTARIVCEEYGENCDEKGLAGEQRILSRYNPDIVVAAGPAPLLDAVTRYFGVNRVLVIEERVVRCGLGFCGGCRLYQGGPLLCRDGPAFPAEAIRR